MSNLELKKIGLKATLARIRILELFEQNDLRHLSAEDVYKELCNLGDDIGLATVYRVLTQFEAAKLLIRHHFADGRSIFELNKGEHHDHLLCIKCGKIEEFFDSSIEERQVIIADKYNFKMTDHKLKIFGLCPDCQQ